MFFLKKKKNVFFFFKISGHPSQIKNIQSIIPGVDIAASSPQGQMMQRSVGLQISQKMHGAFWMVNSTA